MNTLYLQNHVRRLCFVLAAVLLQAKASMTSAPVRNPSPSSSLASDSQAVVHVSPGDPEIRQALSSWLTAKHAGEADTVIMEELGICRGQARIDLAVINGCIHGYEIKSDRDSLRRLNVQMNLYNKVFDRGTIVVGDRHLADVIAIAPVWWGILHVQAARTGLRFKTVRRSNVNPRRDPRSLVELLWRDDAIALLAQRNALRGIRGKPRQFVWDKVCEDLKLSEIAASVRSCLRARVRHPDRAQLL